MAREEFRYVRYQVNARERDSRRDTQLAAQAFVRTARRELRLVRLLD